MAEYDEETRLVLDAFESFIDEEIAPIAADLGDRLTDPRLGREQDGRPDETVVEAVETVRRRAADAGFYAMNLPEPVGGGVSKLTWYAVKKAAAAHDCPLAGRALAGPEGPKPLLLDATDDQHDQYVEPVLAGEQSTAFAQTEPGAGSDSPGMATTAHKEGDEWVIDGHKQWITNAPFADFVQVFARTSPAEEGRYDGITCFIVERDEFELTGVNNAIGLGGWQGELAFDDVRVPETRVLGEVGNAFRSAMAFLSLGRLELGAEAVGTAERLLDSGFSYARDREAFGRPIGDFQQVSAALARGKARTYAADAAGKRCARRLDAGERAVEDTSIFKWFATNALWETADSVLQTHGATGLAEGSEFANALARARVLRVVEGTDEIQLNTIAKENGL
ncbi:acyl-CoA dehydrogenase [Halosegnis rubeus]|jgi:acyl-CoA dehydrogenase|uniref:Acyl-CoA dehydrogenase n=1 Tax=Halosegnis rubeus TaxID=2212850 RepID=A0A5N5UB71_9EURY|nr:acyl-CoA dehydrogenase family protein [Halosegnis rubeus]KAB7515807.1 acyl-CoA dehydrogenase [Halosegnis rubeus]KAB7516978.1 acyl-CoA dehydrogenase [Halosegnis rubeus]KAB7519893.1 acyl-CoA dehydrogenase [Halosegnis rubeus]